MQNVNRALLVRYRVVFAKHQKTGIECEIGSLIPVTSERQLLAQTGHLPDFDECPLSLQSGSVQQTDLTPSSMIQSAVRNFFA